MKEYDITITETLEKTVSVTAASREDAEEKVKGYYNSEYVLDADNFTQVDFKSGEGRDLIRDEDRIDALLIKPGKLPQPVRISTELEDLQAIVGGDIEEFALDDTAGLIFNEEGRLNGLPLNRALRDDNGRMFDIIVGDFLVVGFTEESYSFLTPEQMEKFEKQFHTPETFVKMERGIIALPIGEDTVKNTEKDRTAGAVKRTQPGQEVL
ncbi:MAG: DUF3846 domain-containing protein [Clostridiales bacterium]|nr:DUF3846 domain-containing protein [Clostridiales bacterium]